ncbi:Uncharacterized protein FWK35_00030757 [Aphis craccivora]|uniref:Uncharacterized protein n=1 Tax=Aphis craccivora TaxID=307492 RepID=A0A6G0W4H9_APHCR|nr:Uncharacterized protein FWK35_00030757 [Aphis craccivora]
MYLLKFVCRVNCTILMCMCHVCVCISVIIFWSTKFASIFNTEEICSHSERRDECIDFTMLCVLFLRLCTRERVEIMLQFQTLGVVSCRKMNLVGALGGHFLNLPIVFKSAGKNQKTIKEKRKFLHKTSFRPNRFFHIVVPYEFISHGYLKILPFLIIAKS